MTHEAKKIAAQAKANKTGKETCIYETYKGYRVGFLTVKTVGSAQEVFTPVRTLREGEQPEDLFLIMRVSPERRVTGSAHSEAVAMLTVAGLDVAFAPLGYTYGYERNPAYAG